MLVTCVVLSGFLSLSSASAPLYEYETVDKAGSLGRARGLYQAPVGDFEHFLLAYTWTNEFCCSGSSSQCNGLAGSYASTNFALHGLWPQYSGARERKWEYNLSCGASGDRTGYAYPEYCGSCTSDSACPVNSSISNQFRAQWDIYAPGYSKDTLARHEYAKHGSCLGRGQGEYFKQGMDLMIQYPTPNTVRNNVGKTVTVSSIQSAFGGSNQVGLACAWRGNQPMLEAAYICFTNNNGRPGQRVPCTQMNILREDYTNSCVLRNAGSILINDVNQCNPGGPSDCTWGFDQYNCCREPCTSNNQCSSNGSCLRCANSGRCTGVPLSESEDESE